LNHIYHHLFILLVHKSSEGMENMQDKNELMLSRNECITFDSMVSGRKDTSYTNYPNYK